MMGLQPAREEELVVKQADQSSSTLAPLPRSLPS